MDPASRQSANNPGSRPQTSASNEDNGSTSAFPDIVVTPSVPTTPSRATASRSLRVRRLPSASNINRLSAQDGYFPSIEEEPSGRRRSASAPQPPHLQVPQQPGRAAVRGDSYLPTLQEGQAAGDTSHSSTLRPETAGRARGSSNVSSQRRRRASSQASSNPTIATQEYEPDVVDFLDVIDPEISTLNTLNNVQNSLFIPYLGSRFSRQPTYDLSRHFTAASQHELGQGEFIRRHRTRADSRSSAAQDETKPDEPDDIEKQDTIAEEATHESSGSGHLPKVKRTHTLNSVLSATSEEGHNYAVLPHGTILEGWSDEDKEILNDHVRHLLHSRKEGMKRRWRGFKKYVQKPLGLFVTIYSFLLFFWGLAWVLFLIGWISVGGRQKYFIEICDQVLTALFALVGIGLAPFRIVDTYHMIYIVHYHFLTWRIRRKRGLPELVDPNELPEPKTSKDVELAREKSLEDVVLTPEQQAKLVHHQSKMSQSHTFYKPHETYTHYAFPVKLLLTVIILLDCHSMFQIALGGTTWGIKYTHRPKALTAVILTCSICCNISGGVVISVGDAKSRKKRIVEELFRQDITAYAIKELKKERPSLQVRNALAEEERRRIAAMGAGGGFADYVEKQQKRTADGKKVSAWQRNWKGHWHPRIPKPHGRHYMEGEKARGQEGDEWREDDDEYEMDGDVDGTSAVDQEGATTATAAVDQRPAPGESINPVREDAVTKALGGV